MRTGNKGYTLFELMVSVAIFALIMVGIISLMRTSSIFYMGGQSEVRLQEEAQIALNQIEDLLIDTNDKAMKLYIKAGFEQRDVIEMFYECVGNRIFTMLEYVF